jgi:hypothetical protein
MLEPLKQMMVEYKTLIVNMSPNSVSVVQTMFNLNLFCDLHMLMGLSYSLPMFKSMNALIKFTQWKDVFIYVFGAAIKIYQTNLYK